MCPVTLWHRWEMFADHVWPAMKIAAVILRICAMSEQEMSAIDLQAMIDGITTDTRALQDAHGVMEVFRPGSEASNLVETKMRFQRELRTIRGWCQ